MCLTCVQVGEVWVLNISVIIFQVVAEFHGRVGGGAAFGTVVHLYTLVFASMENVLPDVLSAVGSKADKTNTDKRASFIFGIKKKKKEKAQTKRREK